MKISRSDRPRPLAWTVWVARLVYITAFVLAFIYYDQLQELINLLYSYLLTTWFFNSVYFESLWTISVYPFILVVPYLMSKLSVFDRFKLETKVCWQSAGLMAWIVEPLEYTAPLLFLDTFIMKRYWDVDPSEWDIRRKTWIQDTRALPREPPTVLQISYQLLFSFLIYDLLFFGVHYLVHKNAWLYKHLHAAHHEHDVVFSRVTNKLSVPERVLLIVSANLALKCVRSHPLTRAIFVPLFVSWLTENHCGYDIPFTLDKVVPWGLVGGAPRHYEHHEYDTRNYQPFFTYIDNYITRQEKPLEKKHEE